jgi:hypothetical protein
MQTSEPEPTTGSSSLKDGSQAIVRDIGIILGTITLAVIVFVLFVLRLRRPLFALMCPRHEPDLEHGDAPTPRRDWLVRFTTRIKPRVANVSSSPQWGWSPIRGDERRISPFLAESSTMEIAEKAPKLDHPPLRERQFSDATLVPDGSYPEAPLSDLSLRVMMPGSELDIMEGHRG